MTHADDCFCGEDIVGQKRFGIKYDKEVQQQTAFRNQTIKYRKEVGRQTVIDFSNQTNISIPSVFFLNPQWKVEVKRILCHEFFVLG